MDQSDNNSDNIPPSFYYDDDIPMDISPPLLQHTSTPRPSNSTSTNSRRTITSSFRNPQPSTSSGYGSQRSQQSRSSGVTIPNYQRDLNNMIRLDTDIGIPKCVNYNGRTCHFISSLRCVWFQIKTSPHIHVPRPNNSHDLFTRLFLESYWTLGSMELSMNVQPLWHAFIDQYMARDVELARQKPKLHQHPTERYYDSRLFLERLAGSYSYGRPSALRNRRVTTLVEPNQFFQIFQPILKTRKNHGTCCYNRSYDTNTEERLGVIDITVDGSWARPDQTVETIIEEYLSTEFEVPAISCIDCQADLPGTQSYSVINNPDFIIFSINRAADQLLLGGNIHYQ